MRAFIITANGHGRGGGTSGSLEAVAVAVSAFGTAVHTVREFGYSGLLDPTSGMSPVVGVQSTLFFLWWLRPGSRSAISTALLATAVLQLVGGAILSVLPLPFLPFEPEQSVSHYLSHVFLGVAQVPLIGVFLEERQLAGTAFIGISDA